MTKDNSPTPATKRFTTQLPDTGNGMSDRAGYYDNSESGDLNTPDYDGPTTPIGSDFPTEAPDQGGTGTTFSDGSAVPLNSSLSETE